MLQLIKRLAQRLAEAQAQVTPDQRALLEADRVTQPWSL